MEISVFHVVLFADHRSPGRGNESWGCLYHNTALYVCTRHVESQLNYWVLQIQRPSSVNIARGHQKVQEGIFRLMSSYCTQSFDDVVTKITFEGHRLMLLYTCTQYFDKLRPMSLPQAQCRYPNSQFFDLLPASCSGTKEGFVTRFDTGLFSTWWGGILLLGSFTIRLCRKGGWFGVSNLTIFPWEFAMVTADPFHPIEQELQSLKFQGFFLKASNMKERIALLPVT